MVLFLGICLSAHSQIPNPGFEAWTAGDPDGWVSSNAFPVSLINVTQTTDAHSGTSACRGEVVIFQTAPIGPVIQSGPGGNGFAISEKYLSIDLYYKFTSVGGDKFSVNVALEKGGVPIAQGAIALPASVSTYAKLTVPLNYTTSDIPDLANIQLSITGPVTGSDYHVGSVMFVDDLSFSLGNGINHILVSNVVGAAFPNPAVDIVSFPLKANVSGEMYLYVYDAFGQEVKKNSTYQVIQGENILNLNVGKLSSGVYFYSIIGQNFSYKGKFTIRHVD